MHRILFFVLIQTYIHRHLGCPSDRNWFGLARTRTKVTDGSRHVPRPGMATWGILYVVSVSMVVPFAYIVSKLSYIERKTKQTPGTTVSM